MKFKTFFAASLSLALFTAGYARPLDKAKLDQFLARLAEKNKAMGSLTIAKDGNVVYARSIGHSQINGTESLSDANLAGARKRTPRTDDYARRVKLLHDHGIQVNGSFVLGFDEDRRDCFATLAQWIEANRLECATFHILTPYPGTPLFHQMEREGRLLHRDWSRYDTAHVVFQPKHLSPEELAQGYGWLYQRLFSHVSIWRRRPRDARAVPPYLAMSYLYKRSNRIWHFLIRHNLTHAVWSPLVEITRRRHLKFRHRLAGMASSETAPAPPVIVSAGV